VSPVRRPKAGTPHWVIDVAGDPIEVGGHCGLHIDLQLEAAAPMRGDWVATDAGSRYLVDDVHLVRSRRHAQVKRYQLRVLRLPKMRALTVQQPWAWAIVHGGKDVENRTQAWGYRGPLAIHAGSGGRGAARQVDWAAHVDVHDMIAELTRPHVHREHYTTDLIAGTRWSRNHTTRVPSLLDQLEHSMPSSQGESSGARGFESRPVARLEALDALIRIDRDSADWCTVLDPDRAVPLVDGAASYVWVTAAAGRALSPRQGRHGRTAIVCCPWHRVESDIRSWWAQARILAGWDSPAWQPHASCPLCGQAGSLADPVVGERRDVHALPGDVGPSTIGVLAEHIRVEAFRRSSTGRSSRAGARGRRRRPDGPALPDAADPPAATAPSPLRCTPGDSSTRMQPQRRTGAGTRTRPYAPGRAGTSCPRRGAIPRRTGLPSPTWSARAVPSSRSRSGPSDGGCDVSWSLASPPSHDGSAVMAEVSSLAAKRAESADRTRRCGVCGSEWFLLARAGGELPAVTMDVDGSVTGYAGVPVCADCGTQS
jgi:hypothetical protein